MNPTDTCEVRLKAHSSIVWSLSVDLRSTSSLFNCFCLIDSRNTFHPSRFSLELVWAAELDCSPSSWIMWHVLLRIHNFEPRGPPPSDSFEPRAGGGPASDSFELRIATVCRLLPPPRILWRDADPSSNTGMSTCDFRSDSRNIFQPFVSFLPTLK